MSNDATFGQAKHILTIIDQQDPSPDDLKVLCDGYLSDLLQAIKLGTIPPRAEFRQQLLKSRLREWVATFSVPARKKFIVAKHFVFDVSVSAKVKLGFFDRNFSDNFFGKVEENIPLTDLFVADLMEDCLGGTVLRELGDRVDTTLYNLWHLLALQPNGEERGVLLTNGSTNLFYIKDAEEKLRAVMVDWNARRGYWCVYAYLASNPHRWSKGDRVVSR